MEIKTRLVSESSHLETVSIVGVGGMGKTTLAKEVYDDAYIQYDFHIRAWVTVSQEYSVREIILSIFNSIPKSTDKMQKNETHGRHEENTEGLKELLYKSLKGRNYLIVMDDVPSLHHVHFLNEDESWTLFRKNVFGENSFPPEFETTGKNICRNCRGIALSIIVIAGLLSKATKTHHEWEKIAENISSVVTSNDEQCSKVLHLSYKNLPHHLKCCYLYMGIFPEDFNIPVSTLFKLWIAEGFVKSMGSKTFEDVAEEYLLDLVHRSLVMVSKESSRGKIKTCKLHDLLRNLCTNKDRRGNFFPVSTRGIPIRD
ncbi:putative disease resistance RPP13-like protein 3 [Olea europaea var. sylvestris]|uniref:putative disease resistance RPP13-like protein 3 n=1 Tax=Olea europaea var. sylvestris TaxID=158386 RepID=UPI000C1D2FC3|nr:putative disease resistance RPP13-like protein 3 [Olea europaea var. sylvestris]